jgi:exodeoxyribonuclease VII large subunit
MTTHTVTEVLTLTRSMLAPMGVLQIEGTLAGVNRTRSGGILGELVTYRGVGQLEARLPFVMFGKTAGQSEGFLNGTAAVLSGLIEVTDTHAPLRLNVQRVISVGIADPHGVAGRDALYQTMLDDGTAERNQQQPLQRVLHLVGLVAPAGGGAGRADFLSRITTAQLGIEIVEERAPMSGPTAATAIATAITRLGHTNLIVVARGGGPASELTAFDHPAIAKAIANAAVPVMVAVGHSTDRTLADLVAAYSVATPTAAAAWITDHMGVEQRAAAAQALQNAQQTVQHRERVLAENQRQHARKSAIDQERARKERRITLVIAVAIALVILGVLAKGLVG